MVVTVPTNFANVQTPKRLQREGASEARTLNRSLCKHAQC